MSDGETAVKYCRDMEALLTVAALSTYLKNGMRCEHMSAFADFAARLDGIDHPDQPITSADLSAWFDFNRPVLRDRLRLRPAGLKMWYQGLVSDLEGFPRQDIVQDILSGLSLEDLQTGLARRPKVMLAA